MNSAVIPTLVEDYYGDDKWMCMHKRFLMEAEEREPEVVLIGDFTIAMLAHTEVWEKYFVSMHCLNFGISEDKTQNVLWRIENGEIETMNPKIIVLSVGANNYENTAQEVVEGVRACVTAIRSYHNSAEIVVLKLFPCGQYPNPVREKINQINSLLEAELKASPNIQVVNLDPGFVQTDGTINHHDLYDYKHLTRRAYMQAFSPLSDLIQQLIRELTLPQAETPTLPDE
ncbi:platelet-activating factor acetylhydrolase IB subunit beta-like isoform X1 [Limulus polyphemus]|uniref:Platelet-activating factor acetylhydrolase IB subunit beta-like isoform X1 n=2 Tax=Limulus polyphemus TaxID=6850 RepID=A0ABM1B593_LIMPO|nr:platelet-activating factor acetylhydrolase IB subunit beta-like isoform X1 [Limulus polyphemus]